MDAHSGLRSMINHLANVNYMCLLVSHKYRSVPQICAPPFATLALVQNTGGLIGGMQQFLSQLCPPIR